MRGRGGTRCDVTCRCRCALRDLWAWGGRGAGLWGEGSQSAPPPHRQQQVSVRPQGLVGGEHQAGGAAPRLENEARPTRVSRGKSVGRCKCRQGHKCGGASSPPLPCPPVLLPASLCRPLPPPPLPHFAGLVLVPGLRALSCMRMTRKPGAQLRICRGGGEGGRCWFGSADGVRV